MKFMNVKLLFFTLLFNISLHQLEATEENLPVVIKYNNTKMQKLINPFSSVPDIQEKLYPPTLLVTNVPDSYLTKPLSSHELKEFQERGRKLYYLGLKATYGDSLDDPSTHEYRSMQNSFQGVIDFTNLLNQKNILKTPIKLFQLPKSLSNNFGDGKAMFSILVYTFECGWKEIVKNDHSIYGFDYWVDSKRPEEEVYFRSYQRLANIFFKAYHNHFKTDLPACSSFKDLSCRDGFVAYYRDERGFIPHIIGYEETSFSVPWLFASPSYGDHMGIKYEVDLLGETLTAAHYKSMLFDNNTNLITDPGLFLSFKQNGGAATLKVTAYSGDNPSLPYTITFNASYTDDNAFLLKNVILPDAHKSPQEEKKYCDHEIDLDAYYKEFLSRPKESLSFHSRISSFLMNTFWFYLSPLPEKPYKREGFIPFPKNQPSESAWENYHFIEGLKKKARNDKPEAVKCLAWIIKQEGYEPAREVNDLLDQAQIIQDKIKEDFVKEKLEKLQDAAEETKTPPLKKTPSGNREQKFLQSASSSRNARQRTQPRERRGGSQQQKKSHFSQSSTIKSNEKNELKSQRSEELMLKAQQFVEEEMNASRISHRKLRKAAYKAIKDVFGDEGEELITSVNTVGSHTMLHMGESGVTIPRKHKGRGKDLTIPGGKAKNYILKILEKGIKTIEKRALKETSTRNAK